MKNIFITGVAGFIGSNFASHLIEKGYSVSGIDDLSQGFIENIPEEVNFLECSITEDEKYSKLFDQNIDSIDPKNLFLQELIENSFCIFIALDIFLLAIIVLVLTLFIKPFAKQGPFMEEIS